MDHSGYVTKHINGQRIIYNSAPAMDGHIHIQNLYRKVYKMRKLHKK